MANPEQPEAVGPGKWGRRIKNILITGLRKTLGKPVKKATGYEFQYEMYEGQGIQEIQPVRILRDKNLLNIMHSRSSSAIEVENNWDFFDNDKPKGKRQEIEDLYANSMIYLDPDTSAFEFEMYQNGINKPHDIEEIRIRNGTYRYPVPPKVKIRYPIPAMKRDWVVTISPFGYNKRDAYKDEYQKVIEKICDDAQEDALRNASDEEKEVIKSWIGGIKQAYTEVIPDLLLSYCGSGDEETTEPTLLGTYAQIEKKQYSFVKKAVESSLKIKGYYATLSQRRQFLEKQNVIYYNTFRIIQPVLYGTKDESAVVKDSLESHGWITRPNELGPGLDEYGYTLEVGYDGIVLLDKFNHVADPRHVPTQFVKDIDLLELVNYISVRHDTFRDDTRDGRFHGKTLTIMDYVQANNKSLWGLWKTRDENEITDQSEFIIDLTASWMDFKQTRIKIKPTDKNPAFDLRALKEVIGGEEKEKVPVWKHIGRKHYYQVPDESFALMDENPESHMSSRGASMYVIEKIIREMRKFDDVIKVLDGIGEQGPGFDYGPRPWKQQWGKAMIQHVFDWRRVLAEVNAPLPIEYNEEDYKKMYDIRK
ncbi:hypothetical protein HYT53_01275 [Candidatus Woesearchaeota archaeon]|nr:hypothetical protein [Candidatus Woesearchaeota archaeon]